MHPFLYRVFWEIGSGWTVKLLSYNRLKTSFKLNFQAKILLFAHAFHMVAYFCREIQDSYCDNFRKLSQYKFEVS